MMDRWNTCWNSCEPSALSGRSIHDTCWSQRHRPWLCRTTATVRGLSYDTAKADRFDSQFDTWLNKVNQFCRHLFIYKDTWCWTDGTHVGTLRNPLSSAFMIPAGVDAMTSTGCKVQMQDKIKVRYINTVSIYIIKYHEVYLISTVNGATNLFWMMQLDSCRFLAEQDLLAT